MPPPTPWPAFLLLLFFQFSGSMPGADAPKNISIMFLNPTSVRVSWQMAAENIDKYDVTYKPTDASYRVVAVVAGNSDAVTLENLLADTQYQVTVTAVSNGLKYKSRPIVFRTLEPPRSSPQHDSVAQVTRPPVLMPGSQTDGSNGNAQRPPIRESPRLRPGQKNKSLTGDEDEDDDDIDVQVRGVEVGIVLVVLAVWVGAIVLFFNRWGKIRMLLPYQPDYKQEQLKVPGTSCTGGGGGSNSGSAGPPAPSQQSHSCTQSRAVSRHFEFDQWADCEPPLRPSNAWRSRFLSRRTRSAESLLAASHRANSNCCSIHPFQETQMDMSLTQPRPAATASVDVPILSISAPSPSEEDDNEEDEDQEDPHTELV